MFQARHRSLLIVNRLALSYLFFGFSLGAPKAFASWELQTDFRASVSGENLDRAVAENFRPLSGEETFAIPDMQFSSNNIPVSVSGIVGRARYNLGSPTRNASGLVWDTVSTSLMAEVSIQRIYAATTIRREFNGGVIDIRVEGSCDDVRLTMPAASGASIAARVRAALNGGNLSLQAEQTQVAWPQGAWQVTKLDCRGIEGFGETVRQEALKFLASPQRDIQAGLQSAIQNRLTQWAGTGMNLALAPRLILENRSDILFSSQPGNLAEASGNIQMSGMMRIQLPNVNPQGQEVVRHSFASGAGAMGGGETQIPVAAINSISMGALMAQVLTAKVNGQKFAPFQELMHNNTAKTYAFPDLKSYHPDAAFQFDFAATSAPSLKNIRAGSDGVSVVAEIAMPVRIAMLAPRAEISRYVPYVQFQSQVRATATFRINEGRLIIGLQATKVDLSAAWNQNYVKTYKPNTKIDTALMAPTLAKSLDAEPMTLTLPYWQWSSGRRLVPVAVSMEGDKLKFAWDLRSAPTQPAASSLAQAAR